MNPCNLPRYQIVGWSLR